MTEERTLQEQLDDMTASRDYHEEMHDRLATALTLEPCPRCGKVAEYAYTRADCSDRDCIIGPGNDPGGLKWNEFASEYRIAIDRDRAKRR